MHNQRTEALVKVAGRIIDFRMYELASKLENELYYAESAIRQLQSDNAALHNQLALERKHLTASGRYTNT